MPRKEDNPRFGHGDHDRTSFSEDWERAPSPFQWRLGKANEAINGRATGAVSLYDGSLGSETDSGDDEDMFNLSVDVDVTTGQWVLWAWVHGERAFLPLECPA